MAHMKRREFIAALGGAAAWPLAARAQQPTIPMIGYLSTRSPGPTLAEFRQGLSEAGYFDGRNVAIDFRSAEGQYDRLPLLAADLVRRQVSVIVGASPPSALAAKAATSTIPIVFVGSGDPVEAGLVASFNRPGGNVTGISLINVTLGPKRLELLREMVPKASVMALLVNPNNPNADAERKAMSAAAHALGQALIVVTASSGAEIERAFATLVTERVGAVVLGTDPLFNSQRDHIVTLAAFHALPAIYDWSDMGEGRAYVFVAVEHANSEVVGIHASRSASRFEALEPIRQGVHRCFGAIGLGAARGLKLRHDHGSNYMSGDFQDEIDASASRRRPPSFGSPRAMALPSASSEPSRRTYCG
jgi:putative tryptophan/tyrosine transport system substrate-binding protein